MQQALADAAGHDPPERPAMGRPDDDCERALGRRDLLEAPGDGRAGHGAGFGRHPGERTGHPFERRFGLDRERARIGAAFHHRRPRIGGVDRDEQEPRVRGARERTGEGERVARALGALHADDDRPACRAGGHEAAAGTAGTPVALSTVSTGRWSPRMCSTASRSSRPDRNGAR